MSVATGRQKPRAAAPRGKRSEPTARSALKAKRGRVSGIVLYREIGEQISRDIAAGRYPVGSLLPTEAEFSERLNVGRHTIREALRGLAEQGLIVRRAGSGSTVVAAAQRKVFTHAVDDFDRWFLYPDEARRHHVDHAFVEADRALAERIDCELGTPWLHISAMRRLESAAAPLCWVDLYLQPRFAGVLKSKAIEQQPVHEQIERLFGVHVAEVEVRVSACGVPSRLAEALAARVGSPALLLRRRYLAADGELLQATQTVHPQNRYAYEMKFRRAMRSRAD